MRCLSVHPSSFTFHMVEFSSEAAEQNSKTHLSELTGSKTSKSFTKFLFFRPIRKTNLPPWTLIGWGKFYFSLKLLNRVKRNLTGSIWSQCPLPQDRHPDLCLAETFSTSLLKPLNGIKRNLTGSKISTSSTMFVFFGPIGKPSWPSRLLICWDNFDFSSETVKRNSTKLNRKQDLNVL